MNDTAAQPDTVTPDEPDSGFTPITSQDDLERIIGNRLARERAKYSDYSELKKQAEDATKARRTTEERLAAIEQELQAERHNALRASVAAEKGVPVHRINGATREELEADADDFLSFIKQQAKEAAPKPPPSNLKSGATGSDSRMDPKERAASALRTYRTT